MLISLIVVVIGLYFAMAFFKEIKTIGLLVVIMLCQLVQWTVKYGFFPAVFFVYWYMNIRGLK